MFIWRKKEERIDHPPDKIEVFSRHCYFSSISQHKKRFEKFSREACYENLLSTIDLKRANLTFLLDCSKGKEHFILNQNRFPVIQIDEESEAGSFLKLLEHVEKRDFHPETILYFVEDDYLHREGWVEILLEGLSIPEVEYATLYDHKDKYFFPEYKSLQSKLFVTQSTHWRTIPSTTQTFATRWKTLKRDLAVHRRFSTHTKISHDHKKFTYLTKRGVVLVSPLPGFSTHAEPEFASPCIDWNTLLIQKE